MLKASKAHAQGICGPRACGPTRPGCNLPSPSSIPHQRSVGRDVGYLSLSAYIYRAWRYPYYVSCAVSPRVGEKCTLAFLLFSGLVMKLPFWQMDPSRRPPRTPRPRYRLCLTRSDEDYGGMALVQAHAVVPATRSILSGARCRMAQYQIDTILI